MADWQKLHGYMILLADPPVASLNNLPPAGRERFLADMGLLRDALLAVTDAYRVNYQILGSLEPYLHAHVCPRYLWESDELRRGPTSLYDKTTGPFFDLDQDRELMDRIRTWLAAQCPNS